VTKINNTMAAFDRNFNIFTEITPEMIKSDGGKGILIDLDDTLAPRNMPVCNETVKNWVKKVKESGLFICIVSNNHKKRTTLYANSLDIAFIYNAFKPMQFCVKRAMNVLNLNADEIIFIGDQLMTDMKAAKNVGIKGYLVDPINLKSGIMIKIKRIIEKKLYKRK